MGETQIHMNSSNVYYHVKFSITSEDFKITFKEFRGTSVAIRVTSE